MKPILTISIATYNSQRTLEKVLKSIKEQDINMSLLVLQICDGWSTDDALMIAEKYGCNILKNLKTDPVSAKFLTLNECKTQYLMFLDHDEVLDNPLFLQNSIHCLENNDIYALVQSGYKSPAESHYINYYINEFWDPFSMFIYRLSKDYLFFIETIKRRYKVEYENDILVIPNFFHWPKPLIEICAWWWIVDVNYLREYHQDFFQDASLIPHIFYKLNEKEGNKVWIAKWNSIIHYSSDGINSYLNKIKWRVKNNIFNIRGLGDSWFGWREAKTESNFNKKFLYIPYVFLIFPVLLDTIYLIVTRKKVVYLMHFPLSLYTMILILYFYTLKIFGIKPHLMSYDNSKTLQHEK